MKASTFCVLSSMFSPVDPNSFQDLCEDGVDPVVGLGGVGGHRHSIWSRDNLHAQSYRDMRDIVALPPPTSSSRDNTLSRDMHHINVSKPTFLGRP